MQDTVEELRAKGLDVISVGEIIEGQERAEPPFARFAPARLEGTPNLPEPGIYFGMSDEDYHALPALSNSGIKKLLASPMMFWADTPWLSAKCKRERDEKLADEKAHHSIGKAYHCRIMEGRAAFDSRFVVELDPADYPDSLVHTDQIKAAIRRHTETVPVKPCGARKDELLAQLAALRAKAGHPEQDVSACKVDEIKDFIRQFWIEQPVQPVAKVTDIMPDTGEEYQRAAVKADWIRQLHELEPEAQVFDTLQAEYLAKHAGKIVIPFDAYEQIEIAAKMVDADPECRHAFKSGHAEVTLIWYCPVTGVPMKARVDYLKIKAMVDLKSVGNQRGRSIENAIRWEIATWHYNLQPAVYVAGAQAVRELVRQTAGKGTVFRAVAKAPGEAPVWSAPTGDELAWALKWASHRGDDEWLWVFQQKGEAPITRGVFYPLAGTTHMISCDMVTSAKRKFRQCSEAFGTEPWLDVAPIYTIADEDIPQSATDI